MKVKISKKIEAEARAYCDKGDIRLKDFLEDAIEEHMTPKPAVKTKPIKKRNPARAKKTPFFNHPHPCLICKKRLTSCVIWKKRNREA